MNILLGMVGCIFFAIGITSTAIWGAGFMVSGAVLFAASCIIATIQSFHASELATGDRRRCPACKEFIRADAIRCRYCTSSIRLPEPEQPAPTIDPNIVPAPRQVKPGAIS